MDLGVWLRSLGLKRYEGAFRENEIEERVLHEFPYQSVELGRLEQGNPEVPN